MPKLKILFHSDFSLSKTGFGKNSRNILTHLYHTKKYDIVHYCCNLPYTHPDLQKSPWKSIGSIPDNNQEVQAHINSVNSPEEREAKIRGMCYGDYLIDKVIKEEKPDVYIGVQDIWGVDYTVSKPWFSNLTSVIWTTLDSLPLLPSAVEKAPKIKNYWMWSSFATKEMHRLGYGHVKTMHGPLNEKFFFRLSDEERLILRKKNNIDAETFIIGFVFRNQLRKSVPNLLEGYKIWKEKHPNVKSSLLFHTHFSEGWNIHRLADEYGIKKEEILTTYVCRSCKGYEIKPFTGQEIDCKLCNAQKGQVTTSVNFGIDEVNLNEVYNFMDVYVHPITSGGQEIPVQEAKLTELVTCVTNYSCGEELCEPGSGSLPLDWTEYREHGTEFRKASTKPESIAKVIEDLWIMPIEERKKMGKVAREYVLNGFSIGSVGKKIEEFLDSCPHSNYDWTPPEAKRPDAQIPHIPDNKEWIITIYREILRMNVDDKDGGFQYWMNILNNGGTRSEIEKYFRQEATKENIKYHKFDFVDFLDKNDEGKRLIFAMPESIGDVFISTALFKSIKEIYPEYNLYVATKSENFAVLEGNPYVYKVIQYIPQLDSLLWLEGVGDHKGYFEIAFLPYVTTQKMLTYIHNGKDKVAYKDLKY